MRAATGRQCRKCSNTVMWEILKRLSTVMQLHFRSVTGVGWRTGADLPGASSKKRDLQNQVRLAVWRKKLGVQNKNKAVYGVRSSEPKVLLTTQPLILKWTYNEIIFSRSSSEFRILLPTWFTASSSFLMGPPFHWILALLPVSITSFFSL